jgi:hypothetical protein
MKLHREGDLELETDMGERVRGREAHQQVIAGWLLSVDALPRRLPFGNRQS